MYSTWKERPFLNSSYVKSQIFNSNRIKNCFAMKELHFLVAWKFLNVYVELFLRILLSDPFWKYPSKQKHVPAKKALDLLSVNVIRVS